MIALTSFCLTTFVFFRIPNGKVLEEQSDLLLERSEETFTELSRFLAKDFYLERSKETFTELLRFLAESKV